MDEELTPQEKLLAIDIKERDKPNLVAVAAAIAASFLLYRGYMRSRLKKAARISEPTRHRLIEANVRLFESYRDVFVATLVPSLVAGYTHGLREVRSRQGDRAWMEQVATTYATGLVDVIQMTSAQALVDGFTTQLNRKVPARMAADRVIDAFGVTPRTMKALVNIWLGPAPTPSPTAIPMHNRIAERADRLVERAINERVERLGLTEAYVAKNQAKAVLWLYEKDKHPGAKVIWYTAADERVCPVCGPMHGKTRKLDKQFDIKAYGKAWAPPLHPSCRCNILLAERLDGLAVTLEQEEALQDIRKADWDESDYRRDAAGRFAPKYGQQELTTRQRRRVQVRRRVQIPQAQEQVSLPEASETIMLPSPDLRANTEIALPEAVALPQVQTDLPSVVALPEVALPETKVGAPAPEASLPPAPKKPPKPPRRKWRKLPTDSPLFVIVPPDASQYNEEMSDNDLYFFVSDDSSSSHPVAEGLRKYWDNRIFNRLEFVKTQHEDAEVVPGGLKIHAMDFELSPDLIGAPRSRSMHTVLISDREYAKLWDSAIEGVPSDRAGTIEVTLLDSEDNEVQTRPMEVGSLRSWLGIDAMADQLRPKVGVSEYITESEPLADPSSREIVFPQDTYWTMQGRSGMSVPSVRGGIRFDDRKWGQAHRGVFWITPEDLDVD